MGIEEKSTRILSDIKKEIPGFEQEDLLEYTKMTIADLYSSLKNKQPIEVKCKKEVINKLLQQKGKYRITKDIDHISVQNARIFDCIKQNGELHVQVYTSIYFFDNLINNFGDKEVGEKFWNDAWIITFKADNVLDARRNSNCMNCGAVMQYNQIEDIFKCEYCGNTFLNRLNINWEIIDIELGN